MTTLATLTIFTALLAPSQPAMQAKRVDPRTLGVPLVYEPSRFSYHHRYAFEKLGGASKWVYLLPPRSNQIHTITSFKLSIDGVSVESQGKVMLHTEGYEIVRYAVPASASGKDAYAVDMKVEGVLWNGKLTSTRKDIPSWVAPPELTDAQMDWAAKRNASVVGDIAKGIEPLEDKLRASFASLGLTKLSPDLPTAVGQTMNAMSRGFQYESGVGFLGDVLASNGKYSGGKGGMNCNGTNQYLSAALELLDPENVSVEQNGIVMGSKGEIHMMSSHGKRGWSRLLATDGVMFDNGTANVQRFFQGNSAGGPFLVCQDGGLSVRWTDAETGARFKALNPAGLTFVFADGGKRLGNTGGVRVSFENTPVTDFSTLKDLVGR